ncbi:unnamed protein product [Urochloa humidicola]
MQVELPYSSIPLNAKFPLSLILLLPSQIDRAATGGDMPPPRKVRKKTPPAASIGDLPDGALQLVLSFLPAEEAVRTCVLAGRWRDTWKSAAGLIILCGGETRRKFADSLLRFRGGTPVDKCEFRLLELDKEDVRHIDVWIRHVLQRKVRVLRINNVHIVGQQPHEYVPADLPLISQHLNKLQLQNIAIPFDAFLDFSSCPVLEDLEIRGCDLSAADRLLSQSLKCLTIDDDYSFTDLGRMKICAPNLFSLWLQGIKIKFDDILDFSSCPGLEDLEIRGCYLSYADRLSSQSLKRLTIDGCSFCDNESMRICAPNLVSLWLQDNDILYDGILDFSSCPVLEDLEIRGCDLSYADRLSSQSLKRLTIDGCNFPDKERMQICAPNLISLWLQVDDGCTPLFEGMPCLVGAVTKINNNDWGHVPVSSQTERCAHCCVGRTCNNCFLLHSLSEAQNLALLVAQHAQHHRPRRDLKFYPTFNKLRTLLLNEYWCEPPDFSALASLLEHSPVLEKLTLQLYSEGPKHNVEIKLSCKPMEKSAAISEHLSTVEIKS